MKASQQQNHHMIERLTEELDADIQRLTHDEAIGVIRALVSGEWIDVDVVRLAMRVQRRALQGDLPMTDETIDLNFLAKQQHRILSELAEMRIEFRSTATNLRDDISVLTEMVLREFAKLEKT